MFLIATAITCAVGLPIVFMTLFYRVVEPLKVYVRNTTGDYDATPYQPSHRRDRASVTSDR